MARTKRNAMLIEETRARVQTTQLINRLTKHALSDVPIMDSSQVKAALGLIAKTTPDLTANKHEHSGSVTSYVVAAPDIAESTGQWQKQHAPLTIQ